MPGMPWPLARYCPAAITRLTSLDVLRDWVMSRARERLLNGNPLLDHHRFSSQIARRRTLSTSIIRMPRDDVSVSELPSIRAALSPARIATYVFSKAMVGQAARVQASSGPMVRA